MKKNMFSTKLPVLIATVAVFGGIIAGCGSTSSAPVENTPENRGFQLFRTSCGTCHAFEAAATSDGIGPDLDASFAAARADGMDDDTIKGIVRAQVQRPQLVNGNPSLTMPANLLEGNDLEDVAAYVATYAGTGTPPPHFPGEGPGAQVFGLNGCGSCHTFGAAEAAGTSGPDLDEVIPGMSDEEIMEAIIDPSAVIADDYGDTMPKDFEQKISQTERDQLVEFLKKFAAGGNG